MGAVNVPNEVRDSIEGLFRKLEAANPTPAVATVNSAALHGRWRVRYSDCVPPSNGQLGPFVGEPFQTVDIDAQRYCNVLTLGPLQVVLSADWTVRDSMTWRVNFKTLQFSLWGLQLPSITFPSGTAKTWCMTYTDADTRIVRAGADGGYSPSRELGLYNKTVGLERDAFVFFMTRA